MLKFFEQFPEVLAVVSEKEDGTMLFRDKDENLENRNRFFEKVGIEGGRVVGAKLDNGVNAKIILDNKEKIVSEADALVTKEKNIFLSISVADCIPVFFYETEAKIIGIAHAGWRGIAGGVIKNTIEKIIESGGETKNLKIALGPGINQCHFEVGEEVAEKFKNYKEYILGKNNKYFIDLKGILKKQLSGLGVRPENIENNNQCTYESKNLFSFRRDKPETVEAMVAVIWLNAQI
jgi:YfiH family protein